MTPRNGLADDAMLDVLKFLDRYSLDILQMASRRVDGLVATLNNVCLRNLEYVIFRRSLYGTCRGRFYLRAATQNKQANPPFLEFSVEEADVNEKFEGIVRVACVGRLGVYDVAFTDGLLKDIKSALPTVRVKKWTFDNNDFGCLSPDVFFDAVVSPASISAFSIANVRNGSLAHITRILTALEKKGASEVVVRVKHEMQVTGLTDRGVFRFLTTGTTKKFLEIRQPQLSHSFFEQLHDVVKGGMISAGSQLSLYQYGPLDESVFAQYPRQEVPYKRVYQMDNVARIIFSHYCDQIAELIVV